MKIPILCEIDYFPSVHLNHIYDGFKKLEKQGIVNLRINRIKTSSNKPILQVKVNKKYCVIYDTLDGLNWINASPEENLKYFQNNLKADFYFKRSYNNVFEAHASVNCKTFPLGLNYNITPESPFPGDLAETGKWILKKVLTKNTLTNSEFEQPPIPNRESKIIFLTRLWDPNEVNLDSSREQREIINKSRISFIRSCRKEFGDLFYGGLVQDDFSLSKAKDLVLSNSITSKKNYIKSLKSYNIGIASKGLHNSIGWKLAEYVAASRAILSEPLDYKLPGTFEDNKNYLSYRDDLELIDQINYLLDNRKVMLDIMRHNFFYYHNYVKSDMLVLNSLLKIIKLTV